MFEKVNPGHPDKVADRIAGAIVDLGYKIKEKPIVACEVLIGHGECNVIIETNVNYMLEEIKTIVQRITGEYLKINLKVVKQDEKLATNQSIEMRCGDNGIFKGVPTNYEENELSMIAKGLYNKYKSDGKYIIANNNLIVCQSNAQYEDIEKILSPLGYELTINPLGYWTGGTNVDTGATNRKLGSDMGRAVTGGGLHGKDLSKADVSVNIYAFLKAKESGQEVNFCCAIGDKTIDGKPYSEIVDIAKQYIDSIGGFEKLAEYGLI